MWWGFLIENSAHAQFLVAFFVATSQLLHLAKVGSGVLLTDWSVLLP